MIIDHPASVLDLGHSREDGYVFMLEKQQGVSDFDILSPNKSKKESWSQKKEIWSTQNEKKRKTKEASLSSEDEWNKKKIDVKDEKLPGYPFAFLQVHKAFESCWSSLLMTNLRN